MGVKGLTKHSLAVVLCAVVCVCCVFAAHLLLVLLPLHLGFGSALAAVLHQSLLSLSCCIFMVPLLVPSPQTNICAAAFLHPFYYNFNKRYNKHTFEEQCSKSITAVFGGIMFRQISTFVENSLHLQEIHLLSNIYFEI